MKKHLLTLIFLALTNLVLAQNDFNRWSIETNAGFNKSMSPLTPGYLSPTLNIGHLDFGVRYMLNEKFGFKADAGFGSFSEAKDNSPTFTTNYFRANLQGVANLGRIMNFEAFTRSFGLLGHFGAGAGRLSYEKTILNTQPDYVYNFITGATGQLKLGRRVALTGDISMIVNGRQTYTFDGNEYNADVQ